MGDSIQRDRMRLFVVANPVAGGRHTQRIRRCARLLEEWGHHVELCWTGATGHGRKLIAERSSEFDRVVVAGGDGTVNEVINGLADGGHKLPLALLPAGTTNVLAREISLPRSLERCTAIAITGKPHRISLGMADGHLFALMAGIGFDGQIVSGVSTGLKRWIGRGAFAISGIREWSRGAGKEVVVEDETGQRHSGYSLIVANASLYGGSFKACPRASLSDDHLHACLVVQPGRWALLRTTLQIFAARGGMPPWARQLRFRRLRILTPGLTAQIDGDAWAEELRIIESAPDAVSLVFPG